MNWWVISTKRFVNTQHIFAATVSAATECTSISVFPSLLFTLTGIMSSAIGLKICVKIAGIKKYQSTIKKKKKKHDKMIFVSKN